MYKKENYKNKFAKLWDFLAETGNWIIIVRNNGDIHPQRR